MTVASRSDATDVDRDTSPTDDSPIQVIVQDRMVLSVVMTVDVLRVSTVVVSITARIVRAFSFASNVAFRGTAMPIVRPDMQGSRGADGHHVSLVV